MKKILLHLLLSPIYFVIGLIVFVILLVITAELVKLFAFVFVVFAIGSFFVLILYLGHSLVFNVFKGFKYLFSHF